MASPRTPIVPLIIALLAVGTVAVVPTASSMERGMAMSVEPGNGTVGQLESPGESGPGVREVVDADLSSVLASDRERLGTSLAVDRFERDFDAAQNRSRRIAIVETALTALETRGGQLRQARTDAVHAFNRGELTRAGLLRELTRISTAASGLSERTDSIETVIRRSDFSTPPEVAVRLTTVDAELVSLNGPLTERIAEATRADRQPTRVTIQTVDGGLTLAAVDGGTYFREATLWSARATGGKNEFEADGSSPLVAAHQRAQTLYPWAFENLVSNPSISGFGDSTIYPVSLNHAHGELTAYLDGRTTDVFFELQEVRLSSLPARPVASNQTDALSLTVAATTQERPWTITVTDPATDDPVPATISIGNETRGQTGSDGRLWVLPIEASRTITASNDGDSVSVTTGG